jgi:sporulation integral membrane protein YlbJ
MNFFVINIKRFFFTTIFLAFLICLIIFSKTNLEAARNGLVLWANSVLPSLFPFFIASELIYQTNLPYILGKSLNSIMKPFFNISGNGSIALILGIISGNPIGAKTICNLKKDRIISKIEAERLIAFCNNTSPLFVLGTVGISLYNNKRLGYILFISHIVSSLLVGFCFRFWKKNNIDSTYIEKNFNYKNSPIKISAFGTILNTAIKNSINSCLQIGGFVVLFSIIISILKNSGIYFQIPELNTLFYGIIEMTNGVNISASLASSTPLTSIVITSFLLGFGGLSVLFQVYSIIAKENISIKPYLYGKILHGILACLITFTLI